MRRREFISAFSAAFAAWTRGARAQQPTVPVIGYIGTGSLQKVRIDALNRGLQETGFFETRNVLIEYRWAEGRYKRMPDLVADLIRRRVTVICTPSNGAALAAKAATSQIPIVFAVGLDPVRMGLVSALNRPGGNATGVAFLTSALVPKSVELVRQLLPRVASIAALINPDNPNAESHRRDLQAAASAIGLQMLIFGVRTNLEIDTAFAKLLQRGTGALLVTSDPVFDSQRDRLVDLAARNAVPAIYPWRDFVDAGGLLSYGNNLNDAIRNIGLYAGRILKGEKPADLPVWVPTKFELVLNLKTARTLGMTVPDSILVRADEVIE